MIAVDQRGAVGGVERRRDLLDDRDRPLRVERPGGGDRATEVDALDEQGVDKHLRSVIDHAGRVDISFNAVGIPDTKILGVPLIELDVEQFSLPITT